jgi:ATP-dependent Lhr-like helicase
MHARSKPASPLRQPEEPGSVRKREPAVALPPAFLDWFQLRGWRPRAHQLALLQKAAERRSTLLIAPTGAGKTLAGFLPSLVALSGAKPARREPAIHTLYVSPLKALAVDVERNLLIPLREMDLPVRVEARTGDTSLSRKARQRSRPPDILLTTPEQVALLLSHADAPRFFAGLETVILDELHALAPNKRGDLLALDLARLTTLAPGHRRIGLSATVARPSELRAYLVPQPGDGTTELADLVVADGGARPQIRILATEQRCPGPATPPAMPPPRSTPPSRRTSCRWCS